MTAWRFVVIGLGLGLAAARGATADLTAFARCLTDAGARFYGTSWCPHCTAQRRQFGTAFSEIAYVECSVRGTSEVTEECRAAGVTSYPTWTFADGSRETGRLSLERLASRTRCRYERSPEPEILDVRPTGRGSVLKLPGADGVEIIEVQ
jgi:hypothetical protein